MYHSVGSKSTCEVLNSVLDPFLFGALTDCPTILRLFHLRVSPHLCHAINVNKSQASLLKK